MEKKKKDHLQPLNRSEFAITVVRVCHTLEDFAFRTQNISYLQNTEFGLKMNDKLAPL